MKVSPEMERFFMEQCVGSHTGQMAMVPNNPVIQGIIFATFGKSDIDSNDFREFMNGVADALQNDEITKSLQTARDCPF